MNKNIVIRYRIWYNYTCKGGGDTHGLPTHSNHHICSYIPKIDY
jgi:hypothetical protein